VPAGDEIPVDDFLHEPIMQCAARLELASVIGAGSGLLFGVIAAEAMWIPGFYSNEFLE
jgi:hypothetical protein